MCVVFCSTSSSDNFPSNLFHILKESRIGLDIIADSSDDSADHEIPKMLHLIKQQADTQPGVSRHLSKLYITISYTNAP